MTKLFFIVVIFLWFFITLEILKNPKKDKKVRCKICSKTYPTDNFIKCRCNG